MSDRTKLILIEGFPGSGKSTTAQWLARQWQVASRACRWLYEQHPAHPVVGVPTGAVYKTWDEYFAYRSERWRAFTSETARGSAVVIMESTLLQYPVLVPLRRRVATETMVAFLRIVVDIIRPLAPRLVYLKAPDPDMMYRQITARRGGPAYTETLLPAYETGEAGEFFRSRGLRGFDGLLVYWREHNAICERAVEVLELETLVVDPSEGDWPQRRAAIARFLGFTPQADESPSPSELERYVGQYRVVFKGKIYECAVGLKEGRLVINGVLWPDNGLLWKGNNLFEAESWPFEVVFESAAEGGVGQLSIHG